MSGWNRSFGGENRIYIEVWCSPQIADNIIAHCQGSQFRGIGMIAGLQVLRIHDEECRKFSAK
jgi:hypothetical protein